MTVRELSDWLLENARDCPDATVVLDGTEWCLEACCPKVLSMKTDRDGAHLVFRLSQDAVGDLWHEMESPRP